MALTAFDVLKKAVSLAIVLFMIATVDFVLFQVPHDGALIVPRTNDPDFRRSVIDEHHLDDSLMAQYADFIVHIFTGDFYSSITVRKAMPIEDFIWSYTGKTLFLLGSITLLSILVASVLTAIWRSRANTIGGKSVFGLSILGSSVFPLGIPFIIMMINTGFDSPLPAGGFRDSWGDPRANLTFDEIVNIAQHAILPILSGVLMVSSVFTLVFILGMRRSQSIGNDSHTRTRRLGGLWRALDSETPFSGYLIVLSITSVLVVDLMFFYSGLGSILWQALAARDFPLLMACFFLVSSITAASLFILDLVVSALRDEPKTARPTPEVAEVAKSALRVPMSFDQILAGSWTIYRKSLAGSIALLIIVIMIAVALAAPLVSTVKNPNEIANYEPSHPSDGWLNPLKPSLGRSPYTGYLHPLGTDQSGRDIYSMTVYGFRSALSTAGVIFLVVTAFSLIIGLISVATREVGGSIERVCRAFFSVGSMGLLSIPTIVILFGLAFTFSLENWGITLVFCVVYSMWSWSAISRVARTRVPPSGGDDAGVHLASVDWPRVAEAVLHVLKYGMLIGLMTMILLDFWGLSYPAITSWGSMLESAYERNAILGGYWVWILAPLTAVLLLISSVFVALNTLEECVERVAAKFGGVAIKMNRPSSILK